jgi:hypothetical protein
MSALTDIWNYKIQVVPILLALAITELLARLRRGRLPYANLYAFFLLENLSWDLRSYFGSSEEDLKLTDEEVARLRQKIRWYAGISVLLDAWMVPFVLGAIIALFLEMPTFVSYLVIATIDRTRRCVLSYKHFRRYEGYANRLILDLLSFIYGGYLILAANASYKAYYWIRPFADSHNWSGLLSTMGQIDFSGVLVTVLLAVVATVLANLMTDPRIRDDQIKRIRKLRERDGSISGTATEKRPE